jgi:SRSO17 transposase
LGKQENCRVAVSLSVATWSCSLPIAYRLYLPKEWAEDAERRKKTEVPEEVEFQTKPEIALDQIRTAVAANLDRGVVLADAAYGINTEFRDGLAKLGLQYVVGVQSSMTVWEPGKQALPAKPRGKMGRPPRLLQRNTDHQPVSVKQLAMNLLSTAFREITWREGTDRKLQSRFAAVRVRPAHRDYWKAEPHAEEWLLIEWPRGETEPSKFWISTLPPDTNLKALIKMAKHRWIIERDYEELKQELGLGHFEGRNWRGFHHHATLCIAAYGFLLAERNRFSPSARAGYLGFAAPGPAPDFRPRGAPRTPRAA